MKNLLKKRNINNHVIRILGDDVKYLFYNLPTGDEIKNTSDHYLSFKKYSLRKTSDYKPWQKTEHNRKKTFVYAIESDVINSYEKMKEQKDIKVIIQQEKWIFKL